MLRTIDSLDVGGIGEVAHELVGTADAVVLGLGGILDVADVPCVVAGKLECRYTLALLYIRRVTRGRRRWRCPCGSRMSPTPN